MGFCGIPWELIKGKRTNASLIKTVQKEMRSKYSADLKSYKSACHEDPYLKSFDSSLKERTKKLIGSISAQTETPSLSIDSLVEAYSFLFDVNQDTVNVIIENREDVWKNKNLRSLVDVYFNSNSKTLDLCNTVAECVKKTENDQLIIQLPVKQFDTDKKEKYAKTLEEVNKFKAMGELFSGEFLTQYKSVYEQQVLLLEELRKQREKLDKKERNAKIWKTLSNVVFVTAYASAFVVSVVLAVMGVPAVVTAVATGFVAPIIEFLKWLGKKSKENEKVVKRQKGLVLQIENGAKANKIGTESIEKEVDKLRILFLKTDVEREEEEEEVAAIIGIAMENLKKEVDRFTEKIKEVGEYADKYGETISRGRQTYSS